MSYKSGDIVLVQFPYIDLKKSKKRPVLIIKDENQLNDIICFQITSNPHQSNILRINDIDFYEKKLLITSFVKYDKYFTLSSEIVDKKISSLKEDILKKIKNLFCEQIL